MTTGERVGWLLMDADRAARELHELGPRPDREAKLVAALLEALAASGIRVAGDVEAVRDAVDRARPDYVRVILSVTTD